MAFCQLVSTTISKLYESDAFFIFHVYLKMARDKWTILYMLFFATYVSNICLYCKMATFVLMSLKTLASNFIYYLYVGIKM